MMKYVFLIHKYPFIKKKIENATNVSILDFISQAPCLFYLTGGA